MDSYPRSAQAAQDVLRVIQLKKQEVTQGLGEHDRARLNEHLARIAEIDCEEAIDIVMKHAPLFAKTLTRSF